VIISRHVQVMVERRDGRIEFVYCPAQFVGNSWFLPVDDRRAKPFEKRRIRFAKQLKRLAKIPSTDVEFVIYRTLNDVTVPFDVDREIPIARML